jgi:hypothetical protein
MRLPRFSGCLPRRQAALVALCTLVLGLSRLGHAQPAPSEYLGFTVGADRTLADWTQITGYLAELASRSERVRMDTLGTTTLGRPFVLLTISAAENLARLDEIRESQRLLADPRRLSGPEHRDDVIRSAKNIVLITCSIHSTEVGSSQLPMKIAYRLASSAEPDVLEILENTVLLLVPSLNPDGVDLVIAWYRSSLGTDWEGEGPPFLYHHYIGHDNNRDWYAFTQVETRLAVEKIHNVWHPQIVHDIHQQRAYGARLFIPPWIDPVEPNVDPLLVASGNALGSEIAWDVLREGKKGVVINAIYDAWTPARAYQHYHAGVRILSETASAKLATPLEVKPEELEARRGFDPHESSWNFPVTWEGGTWRLADIMDYMETAAFSLLGHAARNREAWLSNFVTIGERAVAGWPSWPGAWVILPEGPSGEPTGPVDAGRQAAWRRIGVAELVGVLVTGDVEVGRAVEPFDADGRSFPAGSYVVQMRQPYAAFAQTLLERQRYPDLRDYDGGPLRRPYDVTAHTLPLLFGAEAVPVNEPVGATMEPVERSPTTPEPLAEVAGFLGTATNVALYQPYDPSMDEGWTRWVFDRFGVPYTTVHNDDISAGRLEGFTSVLLASIEADEIREGREAGSVPDALAGGLGEAAVAELERFVRDGGTLVALNESVEWVIEELGLPVRNVVQDMDAESFFAPGSLVRLELDSRHPMAGPLSAELAAWLEGGYAFEVAQDAQVRVVARYGALASESAGESESVSSEPPPDGDGLLLSGWLQGGEHIAGRPAIVDIPLGEGRIILFGFRPQYRGQSLVTLPLLFEALRN